MELSDTHHPTDRLNARLKIEEEILLRTSTVAPTHLEETNYLLQVLKTICYGLLNFVSIGDFIIGSTLFTNMIVSTKSALLKEASSYHSSLFQILLLTCNFGMAETIGIFGAQAFGRDKKERLTLLMYQSMFFSLCLFFLALIPLYFFSDNLMDLYGVDPKVTEQFSNLLVYSLPGTLINTLCNNYKIFVYCQDKFVVIGLFSIINLLGAYFISDYLIVRLGLGEYGYGVSWIFLGLGNLLICSIYQIMLIDPRCRILRYRMKSNIWWFFCEWIRNSLTEYHFWIFIEFMVFTLSLIGSKAQIDAHLIIIQCFNAMIAASIGFYIYPRNEINSLLGRGQKIRAREHYSVFLKIIVGASIVVAFGFYIGISLGLDYLEEDKLKQVWVKRCLPWFCISLAIYFVYPLVTGTLRTLREKTYLVLVNTTTSVLVMPMLIYLLSIKFGLGLLGIMLVMILDVTVKVSIHIYRLESGLWMKYN